jgi:hypothetical protein
LVNPSNDILQAVDYHRAMQLIHPIDNRVVTAHRSIVVGMQASRGGQQMLGRPISFVDSRHRESASRRTRILGCWSS